MGFAPFPSELYYRSIAAGVVEALGSFQLAAHMDLAHVLLTMVKRGPWAGGERFRLKIFPTAAMVTPIYTSSWRDLEDLEEVEPAHWVGILCFDFAAAVPINQNLTYHLAIESDGYAETSSFHVGAVMDWPDAVHSDPAAVRRAAQMNFLGYRDLRDHPDRSEPVGQFRRIQIAEGVVITAPVDLQVGADFDVAFDGAELSKVVDVSAMTGDARKAIWSLKKPSGSDYEQVVGVKITATAAGSVTLATQIALDSGTYRLVGVY